MNMAVRVRSQSFKMLNANARSGAALFPTLRPRLTVTPLKNFRNSVSATSSRYFNSSWNWSWWQAQAMQKMQGSQQQNQKQTQHLDARNGLPERARTVIIGGGVIGTSVAYHLSKIKGWEDIVLLEQNWLTSGTTWHAAGLVGCLRNTSNETQLSKVGQELYKTLYDETGVDPGYKNCGSVTLARTDERMSALKLALARCKAYGVDGELISVDRWVEHFTDSKTGIPIIQADGLKGALWLPNDGSGSPSDLTLAFAAGAKQRGVQIFERVRVDNFLTSNEQQLGVGKNSNSKRERVTGMEVSFTWNGHHNQSDNDRLTIEAENVVLCAGQWSRQIAQKLGVSVPLHSAEHYYVITKPIDGVSPDMPVGRDPDAYLYFREWSGGLCVGGFEPNAKPIWTAGAPSDFEFSLLPDDWDQFEIIYSGAMERIPSLETAEIRSFVNGPESFTTDNQYILGEAPEVDKLFIGAGFNSSGIASAGGAGQALADWVSLGEAKIDLWSLDIRRFGKFHSNKKFLRERTAETLGMHYSMPFPRKEFETARNQRVSPLFDVLGQNKACFGQKFGWERPNWYAYDGGGSKPSKFLAKEAKMEYTFGVEKIPNWWYNVRREHLNTRENVTLFDMTSFSKLQIQGSKAGEALNWLCTSDVGKNLEVGKVKYTQMLNKKGGIEADVTVAKFADDNYLVVSSTAVGQRMLDWVRRALDQNQQEVNLNSQVSVTDMSSAYAVIAVMGPKSRQLMQKVSEYNTKIDNATDNSNSSEFWSHENFPFGELKEIEIGNNIVRAQRITYVGELGWELYIPSEAARAVYMALTEASNVEEFKVIDGGYYAIEGLRIEKGYRAWGHELTPDVTPIETGLSFTIDWEKPNFLGKEAVQSQKDKLDSGKDLPTQRLVQFSVELPNLVQDNVENNTSSTEIIPDDDKPVYKDKDLAIPWGGEPIFFEGKPVGFCTSSAYGYTLERGVFMGIVTHPDIFKKGFVGKNAVGKFQIQVMGKVYDAKASLRAGFDPKNERVMQ